MIAAVLCSRCVVICSGLIVGSPVGSILKKWFSSSFFLLNNIRLTEIGHSGRTVDSACRCIGASESPENYPKKIFRVFEIIFQNQEFLSKRVEIKVLEGVLKWKNVLKIFFPGKVFWTIRINFPLTHIVGRNDVGIVFEFLDEPNRRIRDAFVSVHFLEKINNKLTIN